MTNNRLQLKASYFVYSHFLGGPLFSNHPVEIIRNSENIKRSERDSKEFLKTLRNSTDM